MRPVRPISPAEFLALLQRCIPPAGWSPRIAVANSGGPDSTALLFLLATVVRQSPIEDLIPVPGPPPPRGYVPRFAAAFPHQVLSIHVNHDLQSAAALMQDTATSHAERLGLHSIGEKIPWGTPPFPPRSSEGLETAAREARYNRLFAAMQQADAKTIAFAHHADDQVETTLMRMFQGSRSARGLAGIRPVRRWGMGHSENEYYTFGAEGMRSWVVRPFLHVPKDRLMATCEANGLDYVNDPTNFQPDITVRNAIRSIVSSTGAASSAEPDPKTDELKTAIKPHIDQLRATVPHTPPADQLREAARLFGIQLEEIDGQVTATLARARLPSPPSTILLSSPELARVTDDAVRTALVRRCLRFVSPEPWGSRKAEVSGSRDTLRRVVAALWPAEPPDAEAEAEAERQPFACGAKVLATPVAILLHRGEIRYRPAKVREDGRTEVDGWILHRAPPRRKVRPERVERVDVMDELVAAMGRGDERWSMVYDHRFEMTFDLTLLPKALAAEIERNKARVSLELDTKWLLPKVIFSGKRTTPRVIGKYLWEVKGWSDVQRRPVKFQRWIKMSLIRSIDAI